MENSSQYQNIEPEPLKYRVIKSDVQYYQYCDFLEKLDNIENPPTYVQDQIDLLSMLISEYDKRTKFDSIDNPVDVLKALMSVNQLNQIEMATICGIGKGYMSEILSGKKSISKTVMKRIAEHFAVSQDLFNK